MEDWDCDGKPNQANYAACQSKPGNETVTGKRSITSNKFLLSLVSNIEPYLPFFQISIL